MQKSSRISWQVMSMVFVFSVVSPNQSLGFHFLTNRKLWMLCAYTNSILVSLAELEQLCGGFDSLMESFPQLPFSPLYSSWPVTLEYKEVILNANSLIFLLIVLVLTPRTSSTFGQLNPKCRRYSSCSWLNTNFGCPLRISWHTWGVYPHSFETCWGLQATSNTYQLYLQLLCC